METLTLPEVLLIPDKLNPIITKINDYRYFLLEGGRGGGKSQAVGRFILYLAEKYNLRIVCGREIQNSISESVYSLLTDLITKYKLYFEVMATKITSLKSNTVINFRGFREQGAFNIQGMEGVDIVWIDEAQAITKDTLDVLIPTIRKDNAKIFFTMNRFVHNDPVFATFADRKDCLHIHINYDENPFCTKALINEAQECKLKSESDYNHIWLGEPLRLTEDCLFSHEETESTKKVDFSLKEGYGLRIGAYDIARYGDDKCAVVILQQMGALHWEEVYVDQWDHKDLNYTTGRILMTSNEQRDNKSIIDEDGIGGGPLDTLNKGRGIDRFVGFRNPTLSYADNKFYGNNRTANIYKVKDMILKGHLKLKTQELLNQLETAFRFTFDHYQRRILIPKDVMRNKYKIKSPNLADCLLMAVSLIGEVKQKQDSGYNLQPAYYSAGNEFQSAGIR
uniref:Putative terminase n=1 Tax=viral metagenome TaxID=1070528 RepID=A0A6M3JYZ8_9ZZZZ